MRIPPVVARVMQAWATMRLYVAYRAVIADCEAQNEHAEPHYFWQTDSADDVVSMTYGNIATVLTERANELKASMLNE